MKKLLFAAMYLCSPSAIAIMAQNIDQAKSITIITNSFRHCFTRITVTSTVLPVASPAPATGKIRRTTKLMPVRRRKSEVSATVVLTYKNNSPQNLPYIWMQLDQNLFNATSRGQAKMPAAGRSRYGSRKSTLKEVTKLNP